MTTLAEFEERAELALKNELPVPCGINCPCVCCDPIITGSFFPKQFLANLEEAEEQIREKIQEVCEMKTTTGQKCFRFEGLLLSEINTDYGFIDESMIRNIVLAKVPSETSEEKIQDYIIQIRAKFREVNIGVLLIFSCPNYDSLTKGCSIHLTRPDLCRNYVCEQMSPEKVNNDKATLIERLRVKTEQRDFLKKNAKKEIKEALLFYLNGSNQ